MTRQEKIGAVVIAVILAIAAMFPTFEDHAADSDGPMSYDDAVDECSWIAAADNVPCQVLPDGDGWQAVEVPVTGSPNVTG